MRPTKTAPRAIAGLTRRSFLAKAASGPALLAWTRLPLQAPAAAHETARERASELIIDSHVHCRANDPRYPWSADFGYRDSVEKGKSPPPEDAPVSRLADVMRANRVDKAVIVHPREYLWDCRYTGDIIRAQPRKFMGVCLVDPRVKDSPERLAHWVREYAFHGLRLDPHWMEKQMGVPILSHRALMDPLCKKAGELRIPLCLYLHRDWLPAATKVIERHHERLDVVLDHLGGAFPDDRESVQMVTALAKYPRVYLKVSNLWTRSKTKEFPFKDTHDFMKVMLEAYGAARLLWGSNWPGVDRSPGYTQALAMFRDGIDFLSDEDRRWILGKTALKLWNFKA